MASDLNFLTKLFCVNKKWSELEIKLIKIKFVDAEMWHNSHRNPTASRGISFWLNPVTFYQIVVISKPKFLYIRRGVMDQMARQKTRVWKVLVSLSGKGNKKWKIFSLVFGCLLWNLWVFAVLLQIHMNDK